MLFMLCAPCLGMKLSPENPLRRTGFRLLMLFQTIGSMGGGFHFVASHWILFEETGSTKATAWLVLSYLMPPLFLLPVCGVLADRYDRRKLLMGACLYIFLMDLGLLALMGSGGFRPSHLYGYAALMTLGGALYWTTLPAFLREHLGKEELLRANSLLTVLVQGGYLLGAGLAGMLYSRLGAIGCFAVDAAGLAVGTLGWLVIRKWFPDRPRKPRGKWGFREFFGEFAEGVNYARNNLPLFFFALFGLVPRFAAQMANVLLAGFSRDSLKAGAKGFGLIDMSYGLGAMLCGLSLPAFLERFGARAFLPTVALLLAALACVGLSFSSSLLFAMTCMMAYACVVHIVGILANTTLQRDCHEDVVGRLGSLVMVVQYMFAPILVWSLGTYAEQPVGLLLHEDSLRDGFVAVTIFFLLLSGASLFGAYPFLKRLKGRN